MNFYVKAFKSYRLTDRQTKKTLQTDTTKIYATLLREWSIKWFGDMSV